MLKEVYLVRFSFSGAAEGLERVKEKLCDAPQALARGLRNFSIALQNFSDGVPEFYRAPLKSCAASERFCSVKYILYGSV